MQTKHDVIFVYHDFGLCSNQMTCGEHLEIEYVIASLKKYCTKWLGRIFVIGSEPPEQIKKDVIHIYCDNPFTHVKDANIIHKIRYACENIDDLSDDFMFVSDDQIVTRETVWEDFTPRVEIDYSNQKIYDKKYWNDRIKRFDNKSTHNIFQESLYETLKKFPINRRYRWQAHIWAPMNKYKFIDMCKTYDYEHEIGCVIMSLYYNHINQPYVKEFDHKTLYNIDKFYSIINNPPTIIGWFDKVFENKDFRDYLDYTVGFNNDKKVIENNIDKKVEKIIKLRKDIEAGNIIKVPIGEGKFVWKRIKK